jgi:hypothetical protein
MKANNMKAIDFKEDAAKSAFRTILQSRRVNEMARRRYQKGQLLDDGDRWMARWREDVIDPLTGKVKRVRKSDVLA